MNWSSKGDLADARSLVSKLELAKGSCVEVEIAQPEANDAAKPKKRSPGGGRAKSPSPSSRRHPPRPESPMRAMVLERAGSHCGPRSSPIPSRVPARS